MNLTIWARCGPAGKFDTTQFLLGKQCRCCHVPILVTTRLLRRSVVCSVCLLLNDEEVRSAALEVINRAMLLLHNGVGTYRYLPVMPRLRRRSVYLCRSNVSIARRRSW